MTDPANKIIPAFQQWFKVSDTDVRQVSNADPLPVVGSVTGSLGSIQTISLVTTVSLVTAVTSITNPVTVTGSVTSTFATNQISVTGSATVLYAAAASPTFRELVNLSSSIVYIGGVAVTTTSGYAVLGGAAFSMERQTGAVSAIVTAGTAAVAIIGW